jgi:hypothetical protein
MNNPRIQNLITLVTTFLICASQAVRRAVFTMSFIGFKAGRRTFLDTGFMAIVIVDDRIFLRTTFLAFSVKPNHISFASKTSFDHASVLAHTNTIKTL